MAAHRASQRNLPFFCSEPACRRSLLRRGARNRMRSGCFATPKLVRSSPRTPVPPCKNPCRRPMCHLPRRRSPSSWNKHKGIPVSCRNGVRRPGTQRQARRSPRTTFIKPPPLILRNLDRSFFRVRFDRLTPSEQQYLRALADLGPGAHRSGEVAGVLGVSTNKLGPRRDSLIKKRHVVQPFVR